jgi:hypothetical protein
MCSSLSLPTKRGIAKTGSETSKPFATVDEIREVRLLEAGVPRRKLAEWRVRVYQPCRRSAGPLQLIHRLHVVSKAVLGHLSPEVGTVGTGMPGMYSAPHARIVGFLADFREGMPMTGHAEDRRIHDVCGYFVGTEVVLQDLCC